MPHCKFVILAQPRTGSTLVCGLLNSHQGLRVIIEPINPRGHRHHMQPAKSLINDGLAQSNIIRVLDTLLSPDPIPPEFGLIQRPGIVGSGFKIMVHQIMHLKQESAFWQYLRDQSIPVIIVSRQNILMQYVSDLITTVTRQPACWDGKVTTAQVTVPLHDLAIKLLRLRSEQNYLYHMVSQLGLKHFDLVYEHFKNNMTPVMDVVEQLTGNRTILKTSLTKQNSDSLKERVINYAQLIAELMRLNLGHYATD